MKSTPLVAGLALSLLSAGLIVCGSSRDIIAADELAQAAKPKAPKDAPATKAAAPAAAGSLEALLARREQFAKKLDELQKAFPKAADDAERAKIRTEFDKLIKEYQTDLAPKLFAAAMPRYLKDSKDSEAEDVVFGRVQELFTDNRYTEAAGIADKLVAAGNKHPVLLNFGGASHFAIHDFAKAEELLKAAEAASGEPGGQIFNQLGARYLDVSADYVDLWAREQEIRAREAQAPKGQELPRVVLKTNKGDIEIELFENEAPNSVANFISLIEKKFYDGILFHRVLPNFMAQGGDPKTLDEDPTNDGSGGPGYHIACECYQKNARMHFQGSLSMAHAGRDTGGSQFFLTHLPTSHLNRKHTVFGRISKGLDVALGLRQGDKIVSAGVVRKRDHEYKPKTIAVDE